MSQEKQPTIQPETALDYAQQLAEGQKTQQEFTHDWVGAPGEVAPEAAADLVEYLQSRPDGTKTLKSPLNGRRISKANYGAASDEAHYNATLGEQAPEEPASLSDMIRDWADADDRGYTQASSYLENAIVDRIDASNLSEDHKISLFERLNDQKEAIRNGLTQAATPEKADAEASLDELMETGDERPANAEEVVEAAAVMETVGELSDTEGLRARARRIMGRAGSFVKTLPANMYNRASGLNSETEERDGWTRRERVVAGVAGAVILIAALDLAYRYGQHSGLDSLQHGSHGMGGGGHNHVPPTHGTGGGHNPNHHGGSHHNGGKHKHPETQPSQPETLASGDTIWGAVKESLKQSGHQASLQNTFKVTKAVLREQHLSWNGARHLPVGYSFHMPPEHEINELLKTKS